MQNIIIRVNRLLYFLPLLLLSIQIMAAENDKSGEIGVSIGGSYYLGELNKTPFSDLGPAGSIFYRHTLDKRFAIRGLAELGLIGAEGNTIDGTALSFNHFFTQLSAGAEFHFLRYLPANKNFTYSPYVHAGIGLTLMPSGTATVFPNLPFGAGVKYNINKRWIFGLEYTMCKTFTDNIDYVYTAPAPKQIAYAGNKDWIAFFGINISYKIKYRMKCPAIN